MALLGNLKSIFSNAFNRATSDSKTAYDKMDKGQKIKYAPRSERFSYEHDGDDQKDRNWKPETKEEKKTLSPKDYYLPSERMSQKDARMKDIYEMARKRAKGEGKELTEAELERAAQKDYDENERERQISVPSTAIKEIEYNPQTEGLNVKFQGGNKSYFYPDVPQEVIRNWMKASSKGQYFLKNIHDQYTMNPGHRPASKSEVYKSKLGKPATDKQVSKFFKKYQKGYNKSRNNKPVRAFPTFFRGKK